LKIVKNPVLGTWEMAESDLQERQGLSSNLEPCTAQRILIVDDEDALRQSVRKILETHIADAVIDEATDGNQAVEAFRQHHPEVVLMDLAMPGMDGEQAFYRIMEWCEENNWAPPGTIFCTGFDPPLGVRNIVASDPAHCLLQKPVRNQVLVMAIKKRLT
jgi:two-component system, LytTR family, response regulator AlgR